VCTHAKNNKHKSPRGFHWNRGSRVNVNQPRYVAGKHPREDRSKNAKRLEAHSFVIDLALKIQGNVPISRHTERDIILLRNDD